MVKGPLLFVKSPPAYFKEIEEYSLKQFETEVVDNEYIEEVEVLNTVSEFEETNSFLDSNEWQKRKEKLLFLSNPFQRRVYQPLVFIVNDGSEIPGEVYEVNIEKKEILIRTSETIQSIPMENLKELLWRGKPFLDN